MLRRHTYVLPAGAKRGFPAFALLHIHCDASIDLDQALNIYDKFHKRRLERDLPIKPPDSERALAKQVGISESSDLIIESSSKTLKRRRICTDLTNCTTSVFGVINDLGVISKEQVTHRWPTGDPLSIDHWLTHFLFSHPLKHKFTEKRGIKLAFKVSKMQEIK